MSQSPNVLQTSYVTFHLSLWCFQARTTFSALEHNFNYEPSLLWTSPFVPLPLLPLTKSPPTPFRSLLSIILHSPQIKFRVAFQHFHHRSSHFRKKNISLSARVDGKKVEKQIIIFSFVSRSLVCTNIDASMRGVWRRKWRNESSPISSLFF